LLNRHARDITKPGILTLEVRQHGSEGIVVELFTALFIGSRAGMQSKVVDKTYTTERLRKNTFLFVCWVEPVLECTFLFTHCLFAFLLSLDVRFQCGENFPIDREIGRAHV